MMLPSPKLLLGVVTSRAASSGLNLLFSLALLQILTKEDYGTYFYYYTILTFSSLLPGLAINSGFVYRYQNSGNQNQLTSTYLLSKAGMVGLSGAGVGLLLLTKLIDPLAAIAVTSGLLLSVFDSVMCLSQARRQFHIYSALTPLRNTVILVALALTYFFVDQLTLEMVMWALLASSGILATISLYISREATFGAVKRSSLIELVHAAKRFIVFEGGAVLLQRLEVWILAFLAASSAISAGDIAEYGAGFTFAFLFPIISSSVTSILITSIKPGERLGLTGLGKLTQLALWALALALVYSVVAYNAARFVAGQEYHELHWIIPLLCLGMYFSFCTNYARIRLLAHDTDRFLDFVYLTQLGIGLVTCFGLVAAYGLVGAVVSFLVVRLFALVLIIWKFYSENASDNQ